MKKTQSKKVFPRAFHSVGVHKRVIYKGEEWLKINHKQIMSKTGEIVTLKDSTPLKVI